MSMDTPCHVCGANALQSVAGEWKPFCSVSSDVQIVHGELHLAVCGDCSVVQKYVDSKWRHGVDGIYEDYSINHQGAGAEPFIFDSPLGSGPRAELLVRYLTSKISENSEGRLLDIGCANGNMLRAFSSAQPGWRLAGMENSATWEKEVLQIPHVDHFYMAADEVPDGAFDLITMSHVLEHIPQPISYLKRLMQWLRPNGRLILAVPNIRKNPIDLFVYDHCTHFDSSGLLRVLVGAGFSSVSVSEDVLGRELVATCEMNPAESVPAEQAAAISLMALVGDYLRLCEALRTRAVDLRGSAKKFGIMGSSTAAAWLSAELDQQVDFYVDEDPHRAGGCLFDKPIYGLNDVPKNSTVLIPMSRSVAMKIVARAPEHSKFIFLDENEIDGSVSARRKCNFCGGGKRAEYLSLEDMPVAHHMRFDESEDEYFHPFKMVRCTTCGLVQLEDPIPPTHLYSDESAYLTSFQKPLHLNDLIATAVAHQDPGLVLDVGCNDGQLLEALRVNGHQDLIGLEPNRAAMEVARSKGFQVEHGFLDATTADKLLAAHGQVDSVYLRHVLEHISDISGCFVLLRSLIRDDGLLVCELPSIEAGLSDGNPAHLWEEHVNYFDAEFARAMIQAKGFEILEKRSYAFGGGAIAFVARKLDNEKVPGSFVPPSTNAKVENFPKKLRAFGNALRELLASARNTNRKTVMYGAAPRSCTVINGFGLAEHLDFVVDDRKDIQGRLMPGAGLAVVDPSEVFGQTDGPLLCLLGVGADKEYVVKKKISQHDSGDSVLVSLFPPRETLKSIRQATDAIAQRSAN